MERIEMGDPWVSVIVPVYNAEDYIQTALTSILQETRIPLEIIVVDDHSTDCSMEQVRSLRDCRIQIIANPKRGIACGFNAGLAQSQGQFIARCDADDVYPPDRLFRQVNWLTEHPEFDAICGNYSTLDFQGTQIVDFQCGSTAMEITEELQAGLTRTHLGTFTIKSDLLKRIGGCRPYFLTAEDIDLQLRLGEQGRVWYDPAVSYGYRLHAASITHQQGSAERNFFNRLARELQNQRQVQGFDVLDQGALPPVPNLAVDSPLSVAEHIQDLLIYRAWHEHQRGQRRKAIATGFQMLFLAPNRPLAWKNMVTLAAKSLF